MNGGLGGAVAEVVVAEPSRCRSSWSRCRTASASRGKPAELMDAFGLRARDIVAAARRALGRKSGTPTNARP